MIKTFKQFLCEEAKNIKPINQRIWKDQQKLFTDVIESLGVFKDSVKIRYEGVEDATKAVVFEQEGYDQALFDKNFVELYHQACKLDDNKKIQINGSIVKKWLLSKCDGIVHILNEMYDGTITYKHSRSWDTNTDIRYMFHLRDTNEKMGLYVELTPRGIENDQPLVRIRITLKFWSKA